MAVDNRIHELRLHYLDVLSKYPTEEERKSAIKLVDELLPQINKGTLDNPNLNSVLQPIKEAKSNVSESVNEEVNLPTVGKMMKIEKSNPSQNIERPTQSPSMEMVDPSQPPKETPVEVRQETPAPRREMEIPQRYEDRVKYMEKMANSNPQPSSLQEVDRSLLVRYVGHGG